MTAHVFIDAENVKPDVGFMTVEKFRREYKIDRVDIIGKKETISQRYRAAGEPYHVQNCYFGKNSADTWLCVEIAKAVFEEEVETIIIVSSDRDFLPAIKLAVEKNKNVVVISDGFGHRNLKRLLRELKINLNSVQLVDYRDGLTITDTETKKKKKSLSALMKNATPTFIDTQAQKLNKFYSRLSTTNENFFRKRDGKVKIIFVKYGNNLTEVPFVNGMNFVVFANVLRELQIIGKKVDVNKIVEDSLLKMDGSKVQLPSAEEIIGEEMETDSVFDNLSWEILNYFTENNMKVETISFKRDEENFKLPFVAGMSENIFLQMLFEKQIFFDKDFGELLKENFMQVEDGKIFRRKDTQIEQTIFVSYGGEFIEVPFDNGMSAKNFIGRLREHGITGNGKFLRQVLDDSLLKIRGGRVYLSLDEEEDFETDLYYLSATSRKFLSANSANVNFVRVLYKGVLYDVPFVNGMRFSTFAQIVEDLGIASKGASRNVLTGNGFKIIHGMVYL